MRTKTLLIAVAALALTIATSQAQAVYSQNVVGYVQLGLTNGYNFIANQLDLTGTGTNNTLLSCFGTNMPNNTKAFAFVNGGWLGATYNASQAKWVGSATNYVNAALNPGGGVMVQIPATPPTNVTVTFVGNVLQGAITNTVNAGYQVISTPFPLSGQCDTNFGYKPSKNDKIFTWNPSTQLYNSGSIYNGTRFTPSDPQLAVGQPVFLQASSNNVWGLKFNVNTN
ncbi:MAG: hypothetical protein ABSD77_06460 [Verrucomicrobiota bacterium]|jgi:hypothetical protein